MTNFVTYQSAKKYFVKRGHTVAMKDKAFQIVLFDNEKWSLPAFLTMAEEVINA